MKIPLLALVATATLAACSDEGSLLVVDVAATLPITASTLTATISSTMTATRTLSVPIPGGSLTTLEFGHDVGASVDEVDITIAAGGYSAGGTARMVAGDSTVARIAIGPGSDMGIETISDMAAHLDMDALTMPTVLPTSSLTGASIGSLPAWIAVDESSNVYVRHSGGCGTTTDRIDMLKPLGILLMNAVSGVTPTCGGSIVIEGSNLILGGSAPVSGQSTFTTYIQQAPLSAPSAKQITSLTTPTLWSTFAAKDTTYGDLFFTSNGSPIMAGALEQVTADGTAVDISSISCTALYYDPVAGRLLCASGTEVSGSTSLSPLAFSSVVPQFGTSSQAITSLTVDKRGTIYMTCQLAGGSTACGSGSVFAFDPTSQTTSEIADDSAVVTGLSYDSTTDTLVMLAGTTVVRVPLPISGS